MDEYRILKENKQARNRKNKAYNTKKVNESGLEHRKASEECFLFRGGKREADFYPSTGRWKELETKEMHNGGVNKFIAWLDGRETW
jgi:hypothetical protein